MRPRQRQRLIVVLGIVALAAIAIGLLVYALRANMNLFYTPEQITARRRCRQSRYGTALE